MKKITSTTTWNDDVGTRLSCTYTEFDDTGKVIKTNVRFDRIVLDNAANEAIKTVTAYAQQLLDSSQ